MNFFFFADIRQGIEDKVLDVVVVQIWSKKLAAPVVELETPIFYGPIFDPKSVGLYEDKIL